MADLTEREVLIIAREAACEVIKEFLGDTESFNRNHVFLDKLRQTMERIDEIRWDLVKMILKTIVGGLITLTIWGFWTWKN